MPIIDGVGRQAAVGLVLIGVLMLTLELVGVPSLPSRLGPAAVGLHADLFGG